MEIATARGGVSQITLLYITASHLERPEKAGDKGVRERRSEREKFK